VRNREERKTGKRDREEVCHFLCLAVQRNREERLNLCGVHTIYLLSIDAKKEERMAEHFAFSLFTLVFSSHYLHFFLIDIVPIFLGKLDALVSYIHTIMFYNFFTFAILLVFKYFLY